MFVAFVPREQRWSVCGGRCGEVSFPICYRLSHPKHGVEGGSLISQDNFRDKVTRYAQPYRSYTDRGAISKHQTMMTGIRSQQCCVT